MSIWVFKKMSSGSGIQLPDAWLSGSGIRSWRPGFSKNGFGSGCCTTLDGKYSKKVTLSLTVSIIQSFINQALLPPKNHPEKARATGLARRPFSRWGRDPRCSFEWVLGLLLLNADGGLSRKKNMIYLAKFAFLPNFNQNDRLNFKVHALFG